jgi:hypothetical protein
VVHRGEEVAREILDTCLEPDKSFVELREMAIDGTIDLVARRQRRMPSNAET